MRSDRDPWQIGAMTDQAPEIVPEETTTISDPAKLIRLGTMVQTLMAEVREAGLVISWTAGQASALDSARIGQGKDVGTIRVRDAGGADVPHDVMFAFAFHAFWPEGNWMLGQ